MTISTNSSDYKIASTRTDDIANTVPHQVPCRNSRLLRITSYIRTDQTEDGHEGCRACLSHVVSNQSPDVVTKR